MSSEPHCHGAADPNNRQWSFSFGNGYQGTDVTQNALYVEVYYPNPPRPIPPPIVRCPPHQPGAALHLHVARARVPRSGGALDVGVVVKDDVRRDELK